MNQLIYFSFLDFQQLLAQPDNIDLFIQAQHRYDYPADQEKYVIRHAVLRAVLAKMLACSKAEIEISTDQYGKPYLAGQHENACHFNMSASKDWAVIAISDQAVGVDIEYKREFATWLAIADMYFHPAEVDAIDSLETYYAIWTQKEAVVKYLGQGLRYPLDSFNVLAAQPYQIYGYDLISSYATALVSNAEQDNFRVQQLRPEAF